MIDTGEILSKNGQMQDPAKNILKPGDYIVALNEQKISCKQDLINDLETIDGKPVTVSVRRNNSTIPVSLSPAQDASGKYKLGIWVRDDTQGIGTLTYVTKNGNFGALGHGISDIDTGNPVSYTHLIKLSLLKWRSNLILNNLDPGVVSNHLAALLQCLYTAYIKTYG